MFKTMGLTFVISGLQGLALSLALDGKEQLSWTNLARQISLEDYRSQIHDLLRQYGCS